MADVRNQIVAWANWGVANNARFVYTEGPQRMQNVHSPGNGTIYCDCSAFVTYCYSWAGAADPNGQGFDGQGYTGTLLSHGIEIPVSEAIPGDVIVYGPGTGEHTALVVQAGPDPLTISMGEQGDPSLIHVSQDGRQPQRYLRFDTTQIGTSGVPSATAVTPPTSGADVILPTLSINASQTGYVKAVQALLKDKCSQNIAVDGAFGPGTQQAVKNVQNFFKITADGVVGPQTWGILLGL